MVDETEAAIVNRVFAAFIRLGSATPIPEKLNRAGLLNHRGLPFTLPFVRRLLRNRLYLGDLIHRGQATVGIHPAIVAQRIWDKAQAIMAPHVTRWAGRNQLGRGMLAGLLFGPTGALLHEAGISKGKVYRYYGPPKRLRKGLPKSANGRFRADDLERAVLGVVDPDGHLGRNDSSATAACDVVRSLVERVEIGADLAITLKTGRIIRVGRAPWLKTSRLQHQMIVLPVTDFPARSKP